MWRNPLLLRPAGLFLAVLCCLCGGFQALPAWGSQAGWSADPANKKPYFHFVADPGDAPNMQVVVQVTLTAVHDDYRNINSSALTYAGTSGSLSNYVGYNKPLNNLQDGSTVCINMTGDGYIYTAATTPQGRWPTGQGSAPMSGKYLITARVVHYDGHVETASIYGYTSGGATMSGDQPGPPYQDPDPVSQNDPGDFNSATDAHVRFDIGYLDTSGTKQVKAGYKCYVVRNGQYWYQETDSNGVAVITQLGSGTYVAYVTGTHPGVSNSTVYDSGTQVVSVAAGKTTQVGAVFAMDGKANMVSNKDSPGSSSSSGSGTSTTDPNKTNSNTDTWWQTLFKSLFVPQQSTIDGLKQKVGALTTWGPFNLVQELLQAINGSGGSNYSPGLQIPTFTVDSQGHWQQAGQQNVDVTGGITNSPTWGTIRGWLGGFVYLSFVTGLAMKLMPKQTV